MLPVRRALLSTSDKGGLVDFAQGLHELGIEILSTGGTARALEEQGVPVVRVSQVTEFPEILDGRVKTLHPRIHGGILADRGRASHLTELMNHGITPIDLVAVNLYPFEETAARGASYEELVENIDIGGPCMLRAAAKNHHSVVVVVDPEDYPVILESLRQGEGMTPDDLRRRLAAKAFRHTQSYDAAISAWLTSESGLEEETLPGHLTVHLERDLVPRYGENPHQKAAVYSHRFGSGLFGGMEQLQGKELSWNNLLDADAARRMVSAFEEPAVAIIKHNNPSGLGRGKTLKAAYQRALATDPVSAFGSVIAVNRPVDGALAEAMGKLFVEVIIAPGFEDDARARYRRKKNLRLLECPVFEHRTGKGVTAGVDLRGIDGGMLLQELDSAPDEPESWTCPTRKKATKTQHSALEFAWKVVRSVKSNAIVITDRWGTIGIGAGQMSRIDSCRLALQKAMDAGLDAKGCVAASDAFFPFRDGLDVLAEAGVVAIIQPGGSKRDDEVVAAADEHGIALLHTGRRHFRH